MRVIDADALEKRMEERLNALRKEFGNYDHYTDGFEEGCVAVEDAETIDPESLRKQGEWIEDGYRDEPCVCSYCGEPCKDTVMGKPRWNYCPNCGAKMKGAETDA